MTLVSTILTDAIREMNRIAAGTSETPALRTEGLTLLNRIVAEVMGWEVGSNLIQWPVGTVGYQDAAGLGIDAATWVFPDPNVMLACNLDSAQTIYLPPNPGDGARIGVQDLQGNFSTYNLTLNGNGRQIEGAQTLALATDSLVRSWFYRADLGTWQRFSTLTATDSFPFPTEFETWFVLMLALRWNPRLGTELDQSSIVAMRRAQNQFIARYAPSQDRDMNRDLSYLSLQSWNNDYSDTGFNPLATG